MTHEIMIPFDGFYESIHSHNIQREVESIYEDEDGEITDQDKVDDFPYDQQLHVDYAKLYVQAFNGLFDSEYFTFKELISPREYNFGTDRILCEIETDFLVDMLMQVDKESLADEFKIHFTSCSGFHSFYNPDIDENPHPLKWDCNQLEALLNAYLAVFEIDTDNMYIMEDLQGNGEITDITYECLDRSKS